MKCPICNHHDSKVIDSRMAADAFSIRRRRECAKCGFRFSTLEETELLDLTVIKRDGRREAYSRDKLIKGLEKSLEKRPYTDANFKKMIHRIERDIQKKKQGQITSNELGEIVIRALKNFDKIAYIRFASVYRSFEDVQTFQKELEKLIHRQSRGKKKKPKNNGH